MVASAALQPLHWWVPPAVQLSSKCRVWQYTHLMRHHALTFPGFPGANWVRIFVCSNNKVQLFSSSREFLAHKKLVIGFLVELAAESGIDEIIRSLRVNAHGVEIIDRLVWSKPEGPQC